MVSLKQNQTPRKRLVSTGFVVTMLLLAAIVAGMANYSTSSDSVSWFSWLTGKSLSYEFHFLDLVELLHRQFGDN